MLELTAVDAGYGTFQALFSVSLEVRLGELSKPEVLARRRDIDIARERLGVAQRGYQEDLARIRGLVGLPIELLNSLNRLVSARVGMVRVIQDYNLAQMQLFVALGQTPLAAWKE